MAEDDIIETERLHIRRFTTDDADALLPLVSLPDVLRSTGKQPLSSADEVIELLTARQLRDDDRTGMEDGTVGRGPHPPAVIAPGRVSRFSSRVREARRRAGDSARDHLLRPVVDPS